MVLVLALWMRQREPAWIVAASVLALLWTTGSAPHFRQRGIPTAIVLWMAVGFAFGIQHRLQEVGAAWPEVRYHVEESAARSLRRALDDLVDRGEAAVQGAVEVVGAERALSTPEAFLRLANVRARADVSGVAVYDPRGSPIAWAGEHRGIVPPEVRRGEWEYFYDEGPLFGTLYFTRRLAGGGVAMASVLLESGVEVDESHLPFAPAFAERFGVVPRFYPPERARGEAVWDWATADDRPILSVSFATLTQERWLERVLGRGRLGIASLLAAAWLLLVIGWYHRKWGPPGVPIVFTTLLLVLFPLGEGLFEALFSPARFVLPAPFRFSLGDFLILACGGAIWLLVRLPRPRWVGFGGVVLGTLLSAAYFPLALEFLGQAASPELLQARAAGGFALQVSTTLLLATPLFLLILAGASAPRDRRLEGGGVLVAAALALASILALLLTLVWRPGGGVPTAVWSLWAIPVALLLLQARPARHLLLLWAATLWIAGAASLSFLWSAHMDARVARAEAEVERLGTEVDPYLDFLLRQFADRTLMVAGEGEGGINLLYRSWLTSGLAREGYEARISLWSGEVPAAELRFSDLQLPPELARTVIERGRKSEKPLLERFTTYDAVHYLLAVPLAGDRVVTVAVPPRRRIERGGPLATLLHPEPGAAGELQDASLSLVPVRHGDPEESGVRWLRTSAGWRTEALVDFPVGPMHAHLLLHTPTPYRRVVRALLTLVLLTGTGMLLWVAARTLCGELLGLPPRWHWVRSFRGRLTLALFVFFLLPTAAFGAITYSALSREVVRAAAALARHSLQQAAPEALYEPLYALGRQVYSDLLLYQQGAVVSAAVPEVIDLGLFHTWLPPEVHLAFAGGEAVEAQERRQLAGSDYLVAYRRLGPQEVLAAPIPLASGEIVQRRNELAELVLLMGLFGAGLSVVLSLLVARALSRPIDQLSRTAVAVGSGNLRVRLPEHRVDEFGGVYRAFNGMVRRLRRARRDLLRETRRTEAIVAQAATGVLALDADGVVALVNPRAEEILGATVETGRKLPTRGTMLAPLVRILSHFINGDEMEGGEELEVEGQRVRVRMRRLPAEAGESGVVVALEDITAEIRTARVLAWGEMARQVAHEIKNPLTPIKLSVQHLRRAYTDDRPDFDVILSRNVESILREIDHLSEIARAFSRFGTPAPPGGALESVDLARVVEEVLALYRGGSSPTEYHFEAEPGLPRVCARAGELREVLVNLLENAREALHGKGQVEITARMDGGRVRLDVIDSGEGIPPEVLARIFEPQFSTRTSGTGLGLAIVRRLVESWGGEVTAASEVGRGTVVSLSFATEEGLADGRAGG